MKDVPQLGDVSLAESAVYYKPQIEAALEQGGNVHSFDDVVKGVLNRELHLLPLTEQSCAVLELRRYPKLTCYHVFLAVGRLEDLIGSQWKATDAARKLGASCLTIMGRRGF